MLSCKYRHADNLHINNEYADYLHNDAVVMSSHFHCSCYA